MTPKLRLNDTDMKVSLSWIRKFRLLGINRMMRSTQMTAAPRAHAGQWSVTNEVPFNDVSQSIPTPLKQVMTHPRSSFESTILTFQVAMLDQALLVPKRVAVSK